MTWAVLPAAGDVMTESDDKGRLSSFIGKGGV